MSPENKNILSSSKISLVSQTSQISNSSNKPGFIGIYTNKGIDDNRLKGGFIIRK